VPWSLVLFRLLVPCQGRGILARRSPGFRTESTHAGTSPAKGCVPG